MKKNIFKFISLILLPCISIGIFAGCGQSKSCTMDMEIDYSGSDEYGNFIGHDPEYATFIVKEGDEFYEDYGSWDINPAKNSRDEDMKQITILKIKSDSVDIKLGKDKISLAYGESYNIPSALMVLDGANYSYKITFKANE